MTVRYSTDTKNNIQILVDSNFNLYYYWNQAGEVFEYSHQSETNL